MFHIFQLATIRPTRISSYCEPQLACPAINPPNQSAYHIPLESLQPADQTGHAIIRPDDQMTQVDPQATTPRLAGGFEMTCPAADQSTCPAYT